MKKTLIEVLNCFNALKTKLCVRKFARVKFSWVMQGYLNRTRLSNITQNQMQNKSKLFFQMPTLHDEDDFDVLGPGLGGSPGELDLVSGQNLSVCQASCDPGLIKGVVVGVYVVIIITFVASSVRIQRFNVVVVMGVLMVVLLQRYP